MSEWDRYWLYARWDFYNTLAGMAVFAVVVLIYRYFTGRWGPK